MASHPPQAGCCDQVTLQQGTPIGKIQQVNDLRSYVVGDLTVGGKYLVVFTDIYGLDLVNTQLVADQFAKHTGYTVVVPDILQNDIYDEKEDFMKWFSRHPTELNQEITTKFIEAFKAEYKPSYTAGIGYCFGAKYVVQHAVKGGEFDVIAIAHPSFVDEEEVEKIDVPVIISASQIDQIFPLEKRTVTEEILVKNGATYQIDVFSHVSHGFTVRGDRSDENIRYAAEKALADQIAWFKRFESGAEVKLCCC